ncbi:hypothetical protein AGMMS49543_09680 [Betaproteobacteria bacterium]|nr:hypothetical protein AGMMS49543_09680 [Betaproteobacteria bacterium]GHU16972.1 hypothetical protein AGMMS50243_04370 [Betaproteobacteria bacterium]
MTDILLLSLANASAAETNLMAEHGATPLAKKITTTRQGMLADLKAIGATKDLEKIIEAEKILVNRDLTDHTNSPKMASSLKEAQNGLETIEAHIGIVGNPAEYQTVNKSDSLKKMRDHRDLPKDGARQAFRSHDTRLENLDAGRVSDTEKNIIQQRQKNIRIAEKEYINRQYKALGIEPPKPRP